MILFLSFIFGAVVGSFLNVCIYRIPAGISVVSPPSSCPACGTRIPFYHNVPVISYLVLRGRCSSCSAPYSARYPLIEALTGVFAVLLVLRFGLTPELAVSFLFVASLIVITFIDLDHRIIPDVISIPGIFVGFALSFLPFAPTVMDSAIGVLAGGGVLLVIALSYYFLTGTEGMGGGDVKFLAMTGAFLGYKGVIVTLLAGSLAGAVIGIVVMLAFGKSTKYAIPFGPFLAAGAVLHLFYGERLIEMYITAMVGG